MSFIVRSLPVFSLFFTVSIFFTSCGIDDYIYLHPVSQGLHNPSGSEELMQQYFLFRTADDLNSTNDYYKGYEIYYRIYNSKTELNKDVSDINAFAESNTGLIFNWLKDTKKYHRLTSELDPFSRPLVPSHTSNRDVYIRLKSFNNEVISSVFVGKLNVSSSAEQSDKIGSFIGTSYDFGKPLRTDSNGLTSTDIQKPRYSFDYDNINSNDSDVSYTQSSESETKWYVQAYVFAYGYDSSYKPIYSAYFPLGYITIIE